MKELFTRCMQMSAKSHFWHLKTNNYAAHLVFGDLYQYFHTIADELCEAMLADADTLPMPSATQTTHTLPGRAVAEINEFIADLRKEIPKDPHLVNKVEEIVFYLKGAIYKLRHLS